MTTAPDYRGGQAGRGDEADATRCALWGPLDPGRHEHMDCVPVVTDVRNCVNGRAQYPGKFPHVCACECRTCRRAWWADGRPMLSEDGEMVVRAPR